MWNVTFLIMRGLKIVDKISGVEGKYVVLPVAAFGVFLSYFKE